LLQETLILRKEEIEDNNNNFKYKLQKTLEENSNEIG